MNEYALFLEKCAKKKVKCQMPESKYQELRQRFEHFPIDETLDWCWANNKKTITTMRVLNWMKKSKDFNRQNEEKKQEFFQKEIEENDSKRAASMKKADERAVRKSRTTEWEEPDVAKTPQPVLQWASENRKLIKPMLIRELERARKENPYLVNLSISVQEGVAKARLIRLIQNNI